MGTTVRTRLALAAAALGFLVAVSCDTAGNPQGYDPSDLHIDPIHNLVATANAIRS